MSGASGGDGSVPDEAEDDPSIERLRERVEEQYDFEDFTPADMAEMSAEEWQAVFDPDTWITGEDLLDRVEADLKRRVAERELFAVIERVEVEDEERVLAYSDEGYALVSPDGTVEGEGMALREVKPVVAVCAMDDYEAGPMPDVEGSLLPNPEDVSTTTGSLGDRVVLAVGGVQLLAGLVLLLAPVLFDVGRSGFLVFVIGLGFLFIAIVLGLLVANARLSGRFRAEEYRDRLRAAGVGSDERPSFLPFEEGQADPTAGEEARDPTDE